MCFIYLIEKVNVTGQWRPLFGAFWHILAHYLAHFGRFWHAVLFFLSKGPVEGIPGNAIEPVATSLIVLRGSHTWFQVSGDAGNLLQRALALFCVCLQGFDGRAGKVGLTGLRMVDLSRSNMSLITSDCFQTYAKCSRNSDAANHVQSGGALPRVFRVPPSKTRPREALVRLPESQPRTWKVELCWVPRLLFFISRT